MKANVRRARAMHLLQADGKAVLYSTFTSKHHTPVPATLLQAAQGRQSREGLLVHRLFTLVTVS